MFGTIRNRNQGHSLGEVYVLNFCEQNCLLRKKCERRVFWREKKCSLTNGVANMLRTGCEQKKKCCEQKKNVANRKMFEYIFFLRTSVHLHQKKNVRKHFKFYANISVIVAPPVNGFYTRTICYHGSYFKIC